MENRYVYYVAAFFKTLILSAFIVGVCGVVGKPVDYSSALHYSWIGFIVCELAWLKFPAPPHTVEGDK
jgi:hypothetical protein